MAYLTWWRLSSGARLLRDTDAPLAAIATQVGYASEFGFANAFRREFGVAPAASAATRVPPEAKNSRLRRSVWDKPVSRGNERVALVVHSATC
ncbi:helix-turn-helix domain-containing protein [Nocardia amamiensis]|uniref:helix-turn-helix domain-containing protein n=1 Tax=Nocardia amamiensis TaxID=404578 RepID=UPI00083626E1|nr:helix-turn-helix domain-containing protein [Nocardia amamiensis]